MERCPFTHKPFRGENAHKLTGVFSVIERTIHPVIIRLFNDSNIQSYLRPYSEIS